MRPLRRSLSTLVCLLLLAAAASSAQIAPQNDNGTDLKTHKFRPNIPPEQRRNAPFVAAPAIAQDISPEALQQINALLQEKEARTPAQGKIDSQVLFTARMSLGQAVAEGVPYLETGVDVDDQGNLVVDIIANVNDDLLNQLRSTGSIIIATYPEYHSIRALVPPDQVETIAGLADVLHVSPMQEGVTSRVLGRQSRQAAKPRPVPNVGQRRTDVRTHLASLLRMAFPFAFSAMSDLEGNSSGTGQGSQSTEGDVTHRANDARAAFGINGAGLKIGVLSNGVSHLADSQALGDLGSVTVLPGQTGSGDEGTAMLEIVHDIAPGAQLYFATAGSGIAGFAQNIRNLRAAGCDIIIDDVFYYAETPFQDGQAPSVLSNTNGGMVLQAVNDVTADGAMYFSSAGNSGNVDSGTAGVYEGDFVDGGALGLLSGGTVHKFGTTLYNAIAVTSSSTPINLYWANSLGGATDDYDLFVLNSTGTKVLASSTNIQNGTQDPYEQIASSVNVAGNRIVVFKKTGAQSRFFHLNTNRGRLTVATGGQTHGHSSAAQAFAVAATPALAAFPNAFSSANNVETFSSDGPRRVFFSANGTPVTPGNLSSTGGTLRQKPDITAADGVSVTGVGGFGSPFYGTSAAAPHAGAIAALVKSAQPSLSNDAVRSVLAGTALDIMNSGVDRDSGAGIMMAFDAIRSLGIPGFANPELGNITATENPGNGNGYVEAGEGGRLVIELKNTGGVVDATNVLATLTTSTPGVTITQPNTSAYGDLPALSGIGTNLAPYAFTVGSDVPCGEMIDFTLSVNYAGGPNPRVLTFSIPAGPPTVSIGTTLDGIPPIPIPGITTATGSQTGRLYRSGVPSTCSVPKTMPGYGATTGSRAYDSYTFTACRNTCTNVTTSSNNGTQLFGAAYAPSFTASNIGTNYVADAGASGNSSSFGFNATAGTTYTVVVHEVNSGGATGTNYSVQVSGCAIYCPMPNQVPVAKAKDVTISAGAACNGNASVDDGSFDPDGDPIIITQTPVGPYPKGTTAVLLTVTDPKGATSQATASVTVVDSAQPAISCPANIMVPNEVNQCGAVVKYPAPVASDNCPGVTVATDRPSASLFSVGDSLITGLATDTSGNTATCGFSIKVNDTQPPAISSLTVNPALLWPPNHTMQNVTVDYTVTDNCSGSPSCGLAVSSNEAGAESDWIVLDAHNLQLRSERLGSGSDRVYTITATCTDQSGNASSQTATVTVPHDQR